MKLLSCLTPNQTVPIQCVALLLSQFVHMHQTTRLVLFKWLVLIADLVTPSSALSALYAPLFRYLSFATLRPFVCNILYRLTKASHVVPHRIESLYRFLRRCRVLTLSLRYYDMAGNEPPLIALIYLYKACILPSLLSSILTASHHRPTTQISSCRRSSRPPCPNNRFASLHRPCAPSLMHSVLTQAGFESFTATPAR